MATANRIIEYAKSTFGKYATRSGGKQYTNKFTKYYKGKYGINSKGNMPKEYGYVPGFCTLWVGYVFDHAGGHDYIPFKSLNKKKDRWWNTGDLMRWYKKHHKAWVTTDPKKAKKGAIAFKGQLTKGKLKGPTHTCIFLKTDGTYVWTIDGNVSDGKGHNAGVVKKRHKKYFHCFVNIPYPNVYVVNTKGSNLNVRDQANKSGKRIDTIPNGTEVEVSKTDGDWKYLPKYNGWVYGLYLKEL